MVPRQSQTYGSITVHNDDNEEEYVSLVASPDGSKQNKYWTWGVAALLVVGIVARLPHVIHSAASASREDDSSSSSRPSTTGSSSSSRPTFEAADRSTLLSELSPEELGFSSVVRAEDASPSVIWGNRTGPLPTNAWYLNLVSHKAAQSPDETTRAYTIPYIIDMSPPDHMTGMRVHWPVISASDRNMQMIDDFKNGLCLGASTTELAKTYRVDPKYPLSPLGVSLEWQPSKHENKTTAAVAAHDNKQQKGMSMSTHIVRGMPYVTMQYFGGALPSLYSYNGPASGESPILVDGDKELQCNIGKDGKGKIMTVQSDIELHFINSDFTWGVFFSRPVQVKCDVSEGIEEIRDFQLSVVSYKDSGDDPLTVRVSLLNDCTTGKSDIKAHCEGKDALTKDGNNNFADLIRQGVAVFPTSPQLQFAYPKAGSSSAKRIANVTIDWKAATTGADISSQKDLLVFAMPHHLESLDSSTGKDLEITQQCVKTFHGKTCLVRGGVWTLSEDLGYPMSFNAPRPPKPHAIPTLADALSEDILYSLSDNMLRAAADTYFPGKILARVGRVISIAAELKVLADSASSGDSLKGIYSDVDKESLTQAVEAAAAENLPSEKEILKAVEHLKKGVQVWLSEKAEAPFVFDKSWGGLVNCGCRYVGKGPNGVCNNTFPDCPALADVNEDFGNGYYNDHHFHYGYHLYAAAVVAKFDQKWAVEYFEKILLYVRDFANPSPAEEYFTQFRQKDWFLGSSWASGIVSAENSPHGRNEESSSEAIAAYEAIALYGSVMVDVFSKSSENKNNLKKAVLVRDAGQLLTATELRATNRYWHVWTSADHKNTYPKAYKQPVVGMLYDTMASFQTWFAPYAVVSYGIQLMPFTPIAEERDDPVWATELYPLYQEACESAGEFCVKNGWSILQAGLCAETGKVEDAMDQALAISPHIFESLGGSGNSLSNMVWFISTRKELKNHLS